MIQRYLAAILQAVIVLHQENKAIANELNGGESGVDAIWDEMFFGALKNVGIVMSDGVGEGESGEAEMGEEAISENPENKKRRGRRPKNVVEG